jgi:GAF domain-containing protein
MPVLCVDPDAGGRSETVDALEAAGFAVRGADSVATARAALDGDVACVVTEYDLPDGTGLDLIEHAREVTPDAACVLYTAVDPGEIDTVTLGDVVAEFQPKGDPGRLVDLVEFSVSTRTQTAYPLPENEDARLAALERFAADPEVLSESFARHTRIAAELFDVRYAAVGLVDAHHENFLACYGIDLDSVDREDTVCTYAIVDDEVTVIEDLAEDPRFDGNEALDAVGFRFYAGAPLSTPGGNVGTFCLYDDEPGTLSDHERSLLEDFATLVTDELLLRGRLRAAESGDGTAAGAEESPAAADVEGER